LSSPRPSRIPSSRQSRPHKRGQEKYLDAQAQFDQAEKQFFDLHGTLEPDDTIEAAELTRNDAGDVHWDNTRQLIITVPTTMAGLAALVRYVLENPELSGGIDDEGLQHTTILNMEEYVKPFLRTIAQCATTLCQARSDQAS
jgi:hypothetical protein